MISSSTLPVSEHSQEKFGEAFDLNLYLKSQEKTRSIIADFSKTIKAGQNEKEIFLLLEDQLLKSGIEKKWHPTKLRFGSNTTKSFRDLSEDVTLKEEDIFFFDIGPVYYGHEGDFGETFTIGENQKLIHLAKSSKEIFNECSAHWKKNLLTGQSLYKKAEELALKMGYELNTKMYGHRLGDFPHALYCKEGLGTVDFNPAPFLWVLEIHIIDKKNNVGSFFEDILF